MATRRKILLAVIVVLLALPAVFAVVVGNLDWNRFKPTINDKVTAAIGRPFAIRGDLSVSWGRQPQESGWRAWLPWPRITASDIMIANAPWGQAPALATLERATFTLAPLPLLARHVVIRQVQLSHPAADLERQADGTANWVFLMPETGEPSPWKLDLNEIGFDQGRVGYQDAQLKAELEILVDPLGKPVPFAELAGDAWTRRRTTRPPPGIRNPRPLTMSSAGRSRANTKTCRCRARARSAECWPCATPRGLFRCRPM